MSMLRRFALLAMLLGIGFFSTGCCMLGGPSGYGGSCGGGCAAAPSCGAPGPGCGLASHGESYFCGGCSDGGCAGCGDGPVIPCGSCGPNRAPSGCLGLGLSCIGKIIGLDACGCGSGGCGETYYHEWINDPPCCDPCNGCGNWTGVPGAGSLGSCQAGCGGGGCAGGCASGGCDMVPTYAGPSCGVAAPGCGLASPSCGGGGCGGGAGYVGRSLFELPGRALFATWAGVGGLTRELRRGLLPSCQTCNAFSFSDFCTSCGPQSSCGVQPTCGAPSNYFGGAGSCGGGCTTCAQVGSPRIIGSQVGNPQIVAHASPVGIVQQQTGRFPHRVVSHQMRTAHGRPPHKVLSDRLMR